MADVVRLGDPLVDSVSADSGPSLTGAPALRTAPAAARACGALGRAGPGTGLRIAADPDPRLALGPDAPARADLRLAIGPSASAATEPGFPAGTDDPRPARAEAWHKAPEPIVTARGSGGCVHLTRALAGAAPGFRVEAIDPEGRRSRLRGRSFAGVAGGRATAAHALPACRRGRRTDHDRARRDRPTADPRAGSQLPPSPAPGARYAT